MTQCDIFAVPLCPFAGIADAVTFHCARESLPAVVNSSLAPPWSHDHCTAKTCSPLIMPAYRRLRYFLSFSFSTRALSSLPARNLTTTRSGMTTSWIGAFGLRTLRLSRTLISKTPKFRSSTLSPWQVHRPGRRASSSTF